MAVKPPRPRGPHLNSMRCFETAARLGGFAAAAEELSVTSGAVSQQVRALEDWIGAPLFERRSQGVALTALGAQVAAEFTHAFDALGGALHSLRAAAPEAPVYIAALPAVAQLWLSPRMPKVRAANPDLSISIMAQENPPNLAREVYDLSLFFGPPSRAPTQQVIEEDVIFPVCAPHLASALTGPEALAQMPIILDATWADDWNIWRAGAHLPDQPLNKSASFSLYSLALAEARSGAGVLMGHSSLVADDLAKGTLVAPLGIEIATGDALVAETPDPLAQGSSLSNLINALIH
ncbi:LysR family transcriptional regulator [Planktotalea sp.]|uniref:LysR family transcriptional regulator n=1 Tax=Planktotalea sp. TaxID=2029877 RepID=UPI003F6A8B0A